MCWETMGIYSNTFEYIEERTVDYRKPIIHILNKQSFIYENSTNFKKNVIVMGDILEDVQMVRNDSHETILKIGFLNNLKLSGHLTDDYLETFDMVITNDGSLHPVNYIL